jgi:hypothetical protein
MDLEASKTAEARVRGTPDPRYIPYMVTAKAIE